MTDSKSLRMETMRETVAQALSPLLYEIAMGKRDDTPGGALSYEAADAVLTALGLDDLDAAVERAGTALSSFRLTATPDAIEGPWSCRMAAVVLEAAFSATGEAQDG